MSMFGVTDDSEISAGMAEPTAEERFRRVQQSQQASGMFGVPPKPGDLPGQVFLQPTSGPSAQEVIGAGFRQSTVVNLLSLLGARQGGPTGDGYSAWDDIKDKPQYWEYASQFAGFRNTRQSHELMARIDQEKKDKDITAASGLSGVITNVLAEAPLMLLPGRVAIAPLSTMPGVYSATTGLRITRAAESALAWGGAGAAQEAILQNAQITRKPEEAVLGIASATLLGAILGPAAHALRPGLMESATRDLDRVRAELDAHAAGLPPPELPPVPAEVPLRTAAAPAEAAPMAAEAIPAPGENIEKLRSAYDAVMREHGSPQVPISEVAARSGLTPEQVSNELLAASKRGEANLSPSTRGDIENPIVHRGGEPMADVEFKRPAKAAPMAAVEAGVSQALKDSTRTMQLGQHVDIVPDPHAADILDRGPKVLAEIDRALASQGITSLKPLGGGFQSVVLDAGDRVVRMGLGEVSKFPDIPEYLKPIAHETIGGVRVEILPKVDIAGITEADVEAMQARLAAQDMRWTDPATDNLGRDQDGNLKILDGRVSGTKADIPIANIPTIGRPPEAPIPAAAAAPVESVPTMGSAPIAVPAGAAAADMRKLELLTTVGEPGSLRDLTLGTALRGLVKLGFRDLTLRMLQRQSIMAKRAYADVVEIPILTKETAAGQPASYGGAPVQTQVKSAIRSSEAIFQDKLADAWTAARFGADKPPKALLLRSEMGRLGGLPAGSGPMSGITFEEFQNVVGEASKFSKPHDVPQVNEAVQWWLQHQAKWTDRAEKSIPGFEKLAQKEGENHFPHAWNKPLIEREQPKFVDHIAEKYQGDEVAKQQAQGRMQGYQNSLESHEQHIGKLTGQLERKQAKLEEDEVRAEELQRLNKFAYQRSAQLSEPLDTMRANIRTIEQRIQPEMERLEQLGEDIKAEKENFPEIKQADALIFKMIGAAQKLKQAKDPIATIDAVSEYTEHLDELISGFKGGIREASEAAKLARRDLGADALVKLENARAEVKKEIAPWLKQLGKIRKELKEETAARGPVARGGAVFETKIRERGNVIADRLSGQRAEIADINERLQNAHANVAEMRGKLEEEVGRWEGKSAAEAKSAIKARAKYEAEREAKRAPGEPKGGRLTQADAAVDRAVKHILENERITDDPEAIRARAQQTTDRILGSPDGRLPYEDASAEPQLPGGPKGEMLRGSLAHRLLDVSNEFAGPWVETNIMKVMRRFNRTFIPDVLLAERFGDINMTNNFRQIHEEYNRLIDAARGNASEIAKLTKEKAGAIEDLALVRDRLRGVNAVSQTASQRRMGQLSTAARNAVVITGMGLSGLNSLGDAAGDVFMYGMASAFKDGWEPFMRSLMTDQKYGREAVRQAKIAGIAIETQTASRHHAMSGIVDHDEPGSPFERALQFGADKMQLLNLLAPWTDFVKTISFTVGSANLYRAAKAALKGTATAKQKMHLGAGNIQPELYEKIVEDYEKHSNVVGGSRLPNTEAWREETRQAFEGALHRSSNITVTTPGLDLPPEFDTAVGKILLQFKSFTAAATTRILIANLQRSDAQTLQGLVTSLALGMVGYKLNSIVTGSPTSDRPQDWFKESVSRGNLIGWLEEGNTLVSKATAGKLDIYRAVGADKPLSKTAAQSAVEHLLGPTIGKLSDLAKVTGAISSGNVTAGDIHALRRVTFLQNLWEVHRLFTAVEHGADNAFGIKIPEPKQ